MDASGHVSRGLKDGLKAFVGTHPVATGYAMIALVVAVIALMFAVHHYKAKADAPPPPSKFGVRSVNNLTTGSNNPLWWHGAGDAGWGGSVHRETTGIQAAAYMPNLRRGDQVEPGFMHQSGARREGLAPGPTIGPASPCPPGMTATTYQDPDGSLLTRCVPAGYNPNMSACSAGWDPAATAEAEALATVGSLEQDGYGEASLQKAIALAYDGTAGFTDTQLSALMHNGGAP
jgi:hypothetical protein